MAYQRKNRGASGADGVLTYGTNVISGVSQHQNNNIANDRDTYQSNQEGIKVTIYTNDYKCFHLTNTGISLW